jgi:hypothetical protein
MAIVIPGLISEMAFCATANKASSIDVDDEAVISSPPSSSIEAAVDILLPLVFLRILFVVPMSCFLVGVVGGDDEYEVLVKEGEGDAKTLDIVL